MYIHFVVLGGISAKAIRRFYFPLEFPSQRKIWIFLSYTGFLSYIKVHISIDTLRVPLSAPPSLSLRFVQEFLWQLETVLRNIAIYLMQEVAYIRCES